MHALERGEIDGAAFERELAARLLTLDGVPPEAEGLLERMFAGLPAGRRDVRHAARRQRQRASRPACCPTPGPTSIPGTAGTSSSTRS